MTFKTGILAFAALAAVSFSGSAFAGGHYEMQTVYVPKVVTICNPYNSQVPIGQNDCHLNNGQAGRGGSDFTGSASCSARSYTQMNTNCHNETIIVPKQVPVYVEDPDNGDVCADGGGGHNCNHGGHDNGDGTD